MEIFLIDSLGLFFCRNLQITTYKCFIIERFEFEDFFSPSFSFLSCLSICANRYIMNSILLLSTYINRNKMSDKEGEEEEKTKWNSILSLS